MLWISDCRSEKPKNDLAMLCSCAFRSPNSYCCLLPHTSRLLNHLIRSRQHGRQNRDAYELTARHPYGLGLPERGSIVIISFMSLPRKIHPVEETVRAVYEKGVLRPLRPLRLKEQSRVLITLYPERQWRKEFERLLRRMKARTKRVPQELIEAEVTRARAEAKAKRRAARRPA